MLESPNVTSSSDFMEVVRKNFSSGLIWNSYFTLSFSTLSKDSVYKQTLSINKGNTREKQKRQTDFYCYYFIVNSPSVFYIPQT